MGFGTCKALSQTKKHRCTSFYWDPSSIVAKVSTTTQSSGQHAIPRKRVPLVADHCRTSHCKSAGFTFPRLHRQSASPPSSSPRVPAASYATQPANRRYVDQFRAPAKRHHDCNRRIVANSPCPVFASALLAQTVLHMHSLGLSYLRLWTPLL